MPRDDDDEGIEFAALTEALLRPEIEDDPDDPIESPTDLTGVGPATATVFEAAPFTAADVAAKRVSYRDLVDAGIVPVVAERLRRAYSLVWSFEWRVGEDDLAERAAQIRGLGAPEREWIVRSGPLAADSGAVAASDGGAVEAAPAPEPTAAPSPGDECERCGGALSVFAFGNSRTAQCEDCGSVGLDGHARRD